MPCNAVCESRWVQPNAICYVCLILSAFHLSIFPSRIRLFWHFLHTFIFNGLKLIRGCFICLIFQHLPTTLICQLFFFLQESNLSSIHNGCRTGVLQFRIFAHDCLCSMGNDIQRTESNGFFKHGSSLISVYFTHFGLSYSENKWSLIYHFLKMF